VSERTLVKWPDPHDYLVVSSLWDYRQTSRVMMLWDDYEGVQRVLTRYPDIAQTCAPHGPEAWAAAGQHSLMLTHQQVVWYRNIWPSAELCQLYHTLPTEVGTTQGCYRLEAVFMSDPPFLPRVTRPQVPELRIFRAVCEQPATPVQSSH
jgi:hypothetical protein